MSKVLGWKSLFYLVAIQSVIAGIVILLIPSGASSTTILGYSPLRLSLVAFHFLVPVFFIFIFGKIVPLLEKRKFQNAISVISIWLFMVGVGMIAIPMIGKPFLYQSIFLRLFPTIVWFTITVFQIFTWSLSNYHQVSCRLIPRFLIKSTLDHENKADIPAHHDGGIFRWAGIALIAAVLIPSSNNRILNGLPIDNFVEVFAIIALLSFTLEKDLRHQFIHLFTPIFNRIGGPKRIATISIWMGILLGALNIAQYWIGVDSGFFACYRTPLRSPPRGECEVFYQNPLQRHGVSRIDNPIFFGKDDWNLSFVNDSAFNFYPWVPGKILRDRIPFTVNWTAKLNAKEDTHLQIEYSGEGKVTFFETSIDLPPAYINPEQQEIIIPAGVEQIQIDYLHDDGYRTGSDEPPYALLPSLKISVNQGNQWVPFKVSHGSIGWKIIAALSDLLIGIFIVLIIAAFLSITHKRKPLLLLLVIIAAVLWRNQTRDLIIVINIMIFLMYLVSDSPARRLKAFLLLFLSSFFWVTFYLPSLNQTFIRFAGTDMLTYESFARTILHTFSLRAGEDIFFYQPFHRYFVFITRIIFGDGDALRSAVLLALSLFGFWTLADRVFRARWHTLKSLQRGLFAVTVIATIGLFNDRTVWLMIQGVSESLTWVLLPWMMVLLANNDKDQAWMIGMMAGFSIFTRTNHIPSIFLLLVFFAIMSKNIKRSFAAFVIAASILLLGAVHNYYFGGEFIVLPTSAQINFQITPQDLLFNLNDPKTTKILMKQFGLMFGDVISEFLVFVIALRVLLVCWLVNTIYYLTSRKKIEISKLMLIILPWIYLGVQFFFDLSAGYPRQFFIGYLAAGCSVLLIILDNAHYKEEQPSPAEVS